MSEAAANEWNFEECRSEWTEHFDSSDRVFYYNATTHVRAGQLILPLAVVAVGVQLGSKENTQKGRLRPFFCHDE